MPELAAMYAVGVVANLLVLLAVVLRIHWGPKTQDNPYQAHVILGLLCAAMSWPGLFFLLLVEVSLIIITRRKTKTAD